MSLLEEPDTGLEELSVGQWSLLERLGRSLHLQDADLPSTLAAIVQTAVDVVPAAEHASINLLVRGRFEPQYVTGAAIERLDEVQLREGTGPCIEASQSQTPIRVPELADEGRWPAYARLGVELGVRSMICLPLVVDEVRLGSLSLYAPKPEAFTDYDERVASLCGTHAALALGSVQLVDNLRTALAGRDTIGMAKGILMATRKVTADQAFALLAGRSQRTGRKVVDVAARLVETGQMDDDGQPVPA